MDGTSMSADREGVGGRQGVEEVHSWTYDVDLTEGSWNGVAASSGQSGQ